MDRHESHLISLIFDGTNYILWAQAMSSFLKGKKLWRVVTGDVLKPSQLKDEYADDYVMYRTLISFQVI